VLPSVFSGGFQSEEGLVRTKNFEGLNLKWRVFRSSEAEARLFVTA